jgi:hypothetical protein
MIPKLQQESLGWLGLGVHIWEFEEARGGIVGVRIHCRRINAGLEDLR